MCSLTCSTPVTTPQSAPARKLKPKHSHGSTPRRMSSAVTIAPRGIEPSTERSGKSRML